MTKKYNKMATKILETFFDAGKIGLTLKEVSEKVDEEGCGHDCEMWIKTFLDAKVIEKYSKRGNANLYRLTDKGRKALGK